MEADVAKLASSLARARGQALRYARDLRDEHERLEHAALQSLRVLANALDARDRYTRGHSERVSQRSAETAQRLGLPLGEVRIVAEAALLHDIGKIGIPDSALHRNGPLDAAEWKQMRRHPEMGAEIVGPLDFFTEGARIIRHHHERLDGSGYPEGLSGDSIPLGARIVAVADVYDALASDRAYRRALPHDEVTGILEREAGRTLAPDVVAAFLASF